jgi:hypothetical protein
MRADFRVVLDACVLANFSVCDLMLRLAETPRLYLPRWSSEILLETEKTHLQSLGWPSTLATSFQNAVTNAFPEAMVTGYESLISQCGNELKDRHVLACAIRCQAEVIATFNVRDFSHEALKPWNVCAQHPQDYLLTLYSMDPIIVLHKLESIARKRNRSTEDQLIELGHFVPAFAQKILNDLNEAS